MPCNDIFLAIKNGDIDQCLAWIASATDMQLNSVHNEFKQTPLIAAATCGHAQVCHALLAKGAYIEAKDIDLETALHASSQLKNSAVWLELLKFGANIQAKNNKRETPLHIAAQGGALRNLQAVKECGVNANVNLKDNKGSTPLHEVVMCGNFNVCLELLNMGAILDARNNNGETPLLLAIKHGQTDICLALMDQGANLQKANKLGDTPLHMSAKQGHLAVCLALLERGVHLEKKNRDGFTPLQLAVHSENLAICLALVASSANVLEIKSIGTISSKIAAFATPFATPLQAAAILGETSLLLRVINSDNAPETLPARVRNAIDDAACAGQSHAVMLMQSWLARHAIHDLVKNCAKVAQHDTF